MISVFHLEKFTIMRDAVRSLIIRDGTTTWAGGGDDPDRFLLQMQDINADVLLLDIETPSHCIQFCKNLHTTFPDVKIIIHSPFKHAGWINKFLSAGVKGFVSKNSATDQLLLAIKTVYKNGTYICPLISAGFTNMEEHLTDKNLTLKHISPAFSERELQIIDLLTKGFSTKEIAAKLFLSVKTIESHRKNIITKANVRNTAELMNFVSYHGLLVH